MRKVVLVLVGTAVVLLAAALPATVVAQTPGGMMGGGMMDIGRSMQDPLVLHGNAQVTIVHQQMGCHSWSAGRGSTATGIKALLKRGQRLTIVNRDVDMHKFVRLAGPRLALGKPMAMNQRVVLTFKAPGTYKLRTMPVEAEGMPEVETMGRDHVLAMIVVVR